ncbi:hypothetical protein Tsp_10771, partial [Trichinella spiralis]|uniref:hypothetical protein n=1 Tax=Trichinella spiralis TaxID=6334 RepID=UPI0001EFD4E6
ITSSAEFLWCSFCSGQRGKSCSHHFVLNLASQTSQISLSQSSSVRTNPDNVLLLVPLCGLPHPMKLVSFATRVRMDVKAFPSRLSVPLLITSSVSSLCGDSRVAPYRSFVSAFLICGLRHPMKLVPFATRVRMDVKAFPSRPSVPLLITNSQRRNSILFTAAMKYVKLNERTVAADGTCVSYGSDVFPCHAR